MRSVHAAAALVCILSCTTCLALEPIQLTVDEPTAGGGKGVPVTTGMLFPKGALKSAQALRLFDAVGTPVCVQAVETSKWWIDGSVRAVVLDFQADLDAQGKATMSLHATGEGNVPVLKATIEAKAAADRIEIASGPLRLEVSKAAVAASVLYGGERTVIEGANAGLYLRTGDGKVYREVAEGRVVTLEEDGPMRAAIKVTGLLKAEGDARQFAFTTRYHVYAGQPFIRCATTFRYLAVPYDYRQNRAKRIAEERATDIVWTGWGWDVASGPAAKSAVAIRDAVLLEPKAVRVDGATTHVVLWEVPEGAPELKLRGGFASRVNEFVLAFGATAEDAGKLAAARVSPARAFATPEYYCAAGYVNTRPYSMEKHGPFESIVDRWLGRAMKGTPLTGEMHYGDTAGWSLPPWKHICYGMNQDLGHPFAVAFMRTGDRKYFDFLDAFARHVRIDNVVREMAGKGGGITSCLPWSGNSWHTAYYEAAMAQEPLKKNTMMDDSCPPAEGGCAGLPRINAQGAFDHYLLTGDRFSLDVAMDLSAYAIYLHRLGPLPAHHADNARAFRNFVTMIANRYRTTGDPEAKAALDKFVADNAKRHYLEQEFHWGAGLWGDPPAKNQDFSWAVGLEGFGIVRGLAYFIEDTGSTEAKAFAVDVVKRYWEAYEKYCPDLVKDLNEGKRDRKTFHRWTMIAAALAQAGQYSGDKVWFTRASNAWAAACADQKAADAVTFYYSAKLDYWGYCLYAEYGVEYLPFLDAQTGTKKD